MKRAGEIDSEQSKKEKDEKKNLKSYRAPNAFDAHAYTVI